MIYVPKYHYNYISGAYMFNFMSLYEQIVPFTQYRYIVVTNKEVRRGEARRGLFRFECWYFRLLFV